MKTSRFSISQIFITPFCKKTRVVLFVFFSLFFINIIQGATITSVPAGGNWNATTTWVDGIIPGIADDVIIATNASITVTDNRSCNSITWQAGSLTATRTLTINSGVTLTVTNAITYVNPAANFNRNVSVSGTLNCGSINMPTTGGNSQDCILTINSTGIVNITGNLIMQTTFARNHVDMPAAGAVLNIGGNVGNAAAPTAAGGGFTTPRTINLNGTLPQNYWPATAGTATLFKVNNTAGVILRLAITVTTLTIGDVTANSLFKDSGNTVTSTGTLNLQNNSTFRLGRYSGGGGTATVFPAFATRNIDLGTTIEYAHINAAQTVSTTPQYANLTFSSTVAQSRTIAAGTLTVRQNLTIGVNTTFLGSTNNPVTDLGGNFVNNGTFTSGTGLFTMNGTTNQSITGTAAFTGGLTINNTGGGGSNTITLNNNITTTGNLTITSGILDLGAFTANRTAAGGTMTISNGTRLIIGGTNSLPTNYTTHVIGATSTVEYDGTTNAVTAPNGGVAYGNLEIDATGATTSASFPVAGILSVITSRSLIASAGTITMNDVASSITNSGTLTFSGLTIAATPTAQSQYNTSYNVAGVLTINGGVTFAPTGGTITMSAAGSSIVNSGTTTFNSLTIAATPTSQAQYNTSFSIDGALTINGSVTFAPTGGTITMSDVGSSIANSGTTTFQNLIIAATPTAQSQYNTSYSVAGALTINGSVTFAPTGGTITMSAVGSSIANSGTTTFQNLIIAATPTAQSQYNTSFSVAAALTINGGVTFAPTGGTITMSAAGSSIANTGTKTFNNLTIAATPTAQSQYNTSFSVAGALTINGSVTFAPTGGTITMSAVGSSIANSGTTTFQNLIIAATPTAQSQYNTSFSVAAALTINGGVTFAPTGGTITMNNVASSISNAGTLTFNNLTVSATPTSQAQYNTSFTVAGTFATSGAITFAPTGGTITMSGGAGAINNASGTLTFQNLTVSGSSVTSSGNFSVVVTMNVTGEFNPGAASIISGAGTLTGNGRVYVTRTAATPTFGAQYTITNKTLTNLTVDFSGAGAQTVDAQDYGNLVISTNGTRTVTLVNGGTIRVSGVFNSTTVTTTYVVTGNTFEYNGSGAQTIRAFTYNNLIISNAGAKTVLAGTTVNCQTLEINNSAVLTLPDTSVLNVQG